MICLDEGIIILPSIILLNLLLRSRFGSLHLNFLPFEPCILHYSLWELCFAAFLNEPSFTCSASGR
jgi:hypothetical protein